VNVNLGSLRFNDTTTGFKQKHENLVIQIIFNSQIIEAHGLQIYIHF
jgi:hypothetical protein